MRTKRLIAGLVVLFLALGTAFAVDTGIEIQTQVSGIKVFIDGTLRGQTAFAALSNASLLRIDLPPGSYRLGFEHPNYSFQENIIIMVPRFGYVVHVLNITPPTIKSEVLEAAVSTGQAKTGSINIRSNPTQAMVELDGKKITHPTDCRLTGVEIGKHKISISSRQSRGLVIEFDLLPDSTVLIMADFFRRTITAETLYSVDLETNPPGATVRVDGNAMGKTPQTMLLPIGSHTIAFSMEGFANVEKTISVDGLLKVSETLSAIAQQPAVSQPSEPTSDKAPPDKTLPTEPAVSAAPMQAPVEPIIPDSYLQALFTLKLRIQERNAFEEAEKKRALSMQAEVEKVIVENEIPQRATLQVQEYLRRIDLLENWLKTIEDRYDTARDDGLRRASLIFDLELKAIKGSYAIEPWENERDFEKRLLPFLAPVENAKALDLARYGQFIDREKNERVKAVKDLLFNISMKFSSAAYYIEGPRVVFSSGEFDRDKKTWPIRIISSDPEFSYSAQFNYYIGEEEDIGAAYRGFMAALGIGTVACRVEYSYSKMQGSDNLSVIIQRASIYDKTTGRVFASGGERKPIYGVSISDPTKRLAMPKILLESAIPGTVVKVDDRVLGHCPVELSLEEGTHVVSFSWDKVPVSGERVLLTLKFGETKTITAGSSIGFVSIANMPEDGQVLVDSVKIDGRPKDLALKAGVHTVEISSIEFKTWKSQVAVEAGSTQRLEFVGEPALVGMVFVPGGKFDMGAKDVEGRPIRQVSVSSFYIGTYEITQGQYKAIVGTNPSAFANEIDAAVRPVENVSWFDAVEFCNKLSEAEGLQSVYTINGTKVLADHSKNGYRLPTEAEWEFAARGGLLSKNYSFSGSNDASMVAWYEGNSLGGTRATGMLDPNEIGLFDMSGNVWEWCADFYGPFAAEAQVDPQGPSIGENRVIRGGSWYNGEVFSRSAIGSAGKPATKDFGIGFRVLRRR